MMSVQETVSNMPVEDSRRHPIRTWKGEATPVQFEQGVDRRKGPDRAMKRSSQREGKAYYIPCLETPV